VIQVVNASQVASASSLACAKPSGTTTGDILVGFQAGDWATAAAMTAPSAHWQLVGQQDQGSNNIHVKVWQKFVESSDQGVNLYTFAQGASSDGTIALVTLRGAAQTFVYASNQAAAGTSRVCPTVTPTAGDDLLLCCCMVDSNNAACTFTAPGSMAEVADVQSSTFTAMTVAWEQLASGAATGTRTFTSTNGGGAFGGIQVSVAVLTAVPVVGDAQQVIRSIAPIRRR
jgi:hypothetical protein